MRTFFSGEMSKKSTMFLSIRRHFLFILKHLTFKKALDILICIFEMKAKRARLVSVPFYLRMEVSPFCNLKCLGCSLGGAETAWANSANLEKKMMSYQLFRESVRDFLPYLVKVNLYDEGEPLLNPDIFTMVEYLSRHNVGTCVSSNFSLELSDESLSRLVHSGLEHLIVAVDGATPENYGRYRIGGDFHLVIDNIRRLVSMMSRSGSCKPKVELQYIDFDNDASEREMMRRLARKLGVWRLAIIQGSSREGWKGIRFKGPEEARRRRGCYQLWVAATINANGELGACDYGEDHGLANLGMARDFLKERLRNHAFAVELRESFSRVRPLNGICRHCSLYEK